jgi:CspA family cold shock protein
MMGARRSILRQFNAQIGGFLLIYAQRKQLWLDFRKSFGTIVGGKPPRLPAAIPRLAQNRRSGMPTGTVKWFNQTKGYGFIAPEEGGADVFVHISAVQAAGMRGLNENQKISFEMETGRNGKQSATNLKAL